MMHRRDWLKGLACCAALAPTLGKAHMEPATIPGLGFSLYGARNLEISSALAMCADAGYDCVELAVMEDWPCDSLSLDDDAVARIAKALKQHQLRVSALMENLPLTGGADQQQRLRRLESALRLAQRLSSDRRPVVETILGGRPADWPTVRDAFLRQLQDWEAVARKLEVVIALKAHVSGAVHRPEHLLDLLSTIDSPWLRAVYDYSHFQLQGLELAASLQALLPYTVFIHVKDGRMNDGRVQFLLPGEGTIDYAAYFAQLRAAGYRGDIVVEVSGQIHSRDDYQPQAAAGKSYAALSAAYRRVGWKDQKPE